MNPFDETNSSNPWLINVNIDESIIGPENVALTAEYIWSKNGADRVGLMNWVFNHYRSKGFPFYTFDNDYLQKCFSKLQQKDSKSVLNKEGQLKNSSNQGLDIVKHFTSELFLKAKGNKKSSSSCFEVFSDDEKFKKVLMNRMGWKKTREDGSDRPYVFNITDKMIIQGMRSSGLAYSTSHFKPLIAKYIYEKFNAKKVLDPSAGWGARAIAAGSLGLEYYGIDPLTSHRVNDLMTHFNICGNVIDGVSEDVETYGSFPKVDLVFSSIPYFNLEHDSDDETQSDNKFKQYDEWLSKYLSPTVENCLSLLDGHFIICMVEMVDKFNVADDLCNLCISKGLKLKEAIPWKTSTSHLSQKRKTKKTSKNTEKVFVFK